MTSTSPPMAGLQSPGLKYDPVRSRDIPSPKIPLPSDSLYDSFSPKRRREYDSYDEEYHYPEPQNIVKPSNSLQSSRRNHICDHCGASFTRQHNLKSHLLTHTSSKKEFTCSQCGSEFRRLHDLKRHQKLHTGEKPFVCDVCGRRFARADALGRHTKSSGDGGCVNARKASLDLTKRDYPTAPPTIHTAPSSAQISPVEVAAPVSVATGLFPTHYHTQEANMYETHPPKPEMLPALDTAFNYPMDGNVPRSALPSAVRDSSRSPPEQRVPAVSQDVHRDLIERHERLEREHREALERLHALESTKVDESGEVVSVKPE